MDEIRRRLAEIDRQLERSPAYYHKQAINTAPLAFCATGMMAGIIIQDKTQAPIWFWFVILAVCAVIIFTSRVIRLNRVYTGAYLALVCFACVGAIRFASFNNAKPNDIRNPIGSERTLATIRGVIITDPYIDSNDWRFSRFTHSDPASSFYLEVTEAESVNGWVKASGIVRVRIGEPIWDLKAGDCIEMFCWLDRFEGAANPGEFDIAKYMARKGVFIAASVESRNAIKLLEGGSAGLLTRIKASLRKVATEALLGGSYPKNEEDKLLLALILGYRAKIDKDTYTAFRRTGLLHFICLSGMNFGIVIGFVWWVCKAAGLLKPGRAIVCMVAAVLFLLVVPENPPALRAAVMCFSFCAAFIFRRRSNPFNSLALAAVVLLLIRPTGLFEAGWQLSFASVLGILLFTEPINSLLRVKASAWFGNTDKPGLVGRAVVKIASVVGSIFAVSLAAWLTSAGILIYHFHEFQWLTSIWTVIVSPLIGLVSFLGYLKLFVAFFLPSVATILGVAVTHLSTLLIWIVKLLARLDISQILIGKINVSAVILFYALVIFVFLFPLRKPTIKKIICAATAAVLIMMLATPRWQREHGNDLIITTLDVGHGQAMLAEMPGGTNILFDAGSLSRNDTGTRVVVPLLRYNGITKLDAVVISHTDIDHINGLLEILDNYPAEVIYSNDIFYTDQQNRPTVDFLREELTTRDAELRPVEDKIPAASPATIEVLWPNREIYENNEISPNDKSVVTMIEYAGRRILICSDVEKFAQKELLRLYPNLKTDVMIAPHHGSAKTLEQNFLKIIEPNVVISSCTRTSCDKGHVIKQNGNFRAYYTGRDGAVTIRVTEQGTLVTDTFVKQKQPF